MSPKKNKEKAQNKHTIANPIKLATESLKNSFQSLIYQPEDLKILENIASAAATLAIENNNPILIEESAKALATQAPEVFVNTTIKILEQCFKFNNFDLPLRFINKFSRIEKFSLARKLSTEQKNSLFKFFKLPLSQSNLKIETQYNYALIGAKLFLLLDYKKIAAHFYQEAYRFTENSAQQLDYLQLALELNSTDPSIHHSLAFFHSENIDIHNTEQNQFKLARYHYEKVFEFDKNPNPEVYFNFAQCLRENDHLLQALEVIRHITAPGSSVDLTIRAEALIKQAHILRELTQYLDAFQAHEAGLMLLAQDPHSKQRSEAELNYFLTFHYELDQLKSSPCNFIIINYHFGLYHFTKNEYAEAFNYFHAAIVAIPTTPSYDPQEIAKICVDIGLKYISRLKKDKSPDLVNSALYILPQVLNHIIIKDNDENYYFIKLWSDYLKQDLVSIRNTIDNSIPFGNLAYNMIDFLLMLANDLKQFVAEAEACFSEAEAIVQAMFEYNCKHNPRNMQSHIKHKNLQIINIYNHKMAFYRAVQLFDKADACFKFISTLLDEDCRLYKEYNEDKIKILHQKVLLLEDVAKSTPENKIKHYKEAITAISKIKNLMGNNNNSPFDLTENFLQNCLVLADTYFAQNDFLSAIMYFSDYFRFNNADNAEQSEIIDRYWASLKHVIDNSPRNSRKSLQESVLITHIEKIIKLKAKDLSGISFYLGHLYNRTKDFENAETYLTQAQTQDPSFLPRIDVEFAFFYYQRALHNFSIGKFPEAIKDFESHLKMTAVPINDKIQKKISKCFYQMAELQPTDNLTDYDIIIDLLDKAFRLNPQYKRHLANAYKNRAKIQPDSNKALIDLNRALELAPYNVDAHFQRGCVYQTQNNYKSALSDFDYIIEQNSHHTLTYFNRALIHYQSNEYKNALDDCNEAIKLNPAFTEAYGVRALARLGQRECNQSASLTDKKVTQDAKKYFESPDQDPSNANITSELGYRLGNIYCTEKKYSLAIRAYSWVIKTEPSPSVYFDRALAYLENNDLDNALKDLNDSIKLDSDCAEAHYQSSLILIKQNQRKLAQSSLRTAVQLNSKFLTTFLDATVPFQENRDYLNLIEYLRLAKSILKSNDNSQLAKEIHSQLSNALFCQGNLLSTHKTTLAEAVNYWHKAADSNHRIAQYRLGVHYQSADPKQAFAWMIKSAEQGFTEAQYIAAYYYVSGVGTLKNMNKALALFKAAADKNHQRAIEYLKACTHKTELKEEERKTFEQIKACADYDCADRIYETALNYEQGIGVPINLTASVEYFEKAAQMKHVKATFRLGIGHALGSPGFTQDGEKALTYFQTVVKLMPDHSDALTWLGAMYYYKSLKEAHLKLKTHESKNIGDFLTPQTEWKEAIACFDKATKLNNVDALYLQGIWHSYTDSKLSFECLNQAAEKGNYLAKLILGHAYETGSQIPMNSQTALALYLEAEKAPLADAYVYLYLGRYYEKRSEPGNFEKAVYYYTQTLQKHQHFFHELLNLCLENENGPREYALLSLGRLYFNGSVQDDIKPDFKKAKKYFELIQDNFFEVAGYLQECIEETVVVKSIAMPKDHPTYFYQAVQPQIQALYTVYQWGGNIYYQAHSPMPPRYYSNLNNNTFFSQPRVMYDNVVYSGPNFEPI